MGWSEIGLAPDCAKFLLNTTFFLWKLFNGAPPSATMPTATTTKSAMGGTKRKSAPVKDPHVKKSKKPKIDFGKRPTLKTKTKPIPVKVEELSDQNSEDSDSDGGVPLNFESDDSEDVDKAESESEEAEQLEESDSEEIPSAKDGLHPERAKAVVTNSMISCPSSIMLD